MTDEQLATRRANAPDLGLNHNYLYFDTSILIILDELQTLNNNYIFRVNNHKYIIIVIISTSSVNSALKYWDRYTIILLNILKAFRKCLLGLLKLLVDTWLLNPLYLRIWYVDRLG